MAADPQTQGETFDVLGVQRPAEIVNYQSTGATPGDLDRGSRCRSGRCSGPHSRRLSPSPPP